MKGFPWVRITVLSAAYYLWLQNSASIPRAIRGGSDLAALGGAGMEMSIK
jgi:hypothetical protein